MSRPTRSTVNSWDVMVLLQSAESLETTAENLRTQTKTMADAPMNVEGWSGKSRRACEDRTTSDRDEINKLGTELSAAARVLHDTAAAISPNRSTVLTKALGLELDRFNVSDDWTVRDARDYASELNGVEAGSAAEQSIRNDQAKRAEEAKTATLSLQSLADQIGEDDRNGARALNVVFGNAEINAPLSSSFSAGQASRDVQAIMSGTATPEQKERFYRATSLTPEQRAALARGEEAVISKEQFDYLKAIYTPNWGQSAEGSAPYSLDALKRFGDEYSGAEKYKLKNALGDGIYMLGNPSLRTEQQAEPMFLAGPLQQLGAAPGPRYVSGGLNELSTPVRELLSKSAATRLAEDSNDNEDSSKHVSVTNVENYRDLKLLMDVLEHRSQDLDGGNYGWKSVQLGSDVDRALLARASEIADHDGRDGFYAHGRDSLSRTDAEDLLIRMLDVAGADRVAVHDAVTAASEGDSDSSMPTTYSSDGKPHAFGADALKNLFTFNWDDEAGYHDAGINRLFNWIPETAVAPAGSPPEALLESERAGNIASSLAEFFGENRSELTDIDPDGSKKALGEINPELARTLASSMGPYFAAMAGGDQAMFGLNGVSEVDPKDLTATFETLNSDAQAGRIANSMAVLQVDRLEAEFGRNVEAYELGQVAGRVEGAMLRGIDAHILDTQGDQRYLEAKSAAERSALFETAQSLANIPGLKQSVAYVLNGVSPELKLAFSGDPVDADDDNSRVPNELLELRREAYEEQTESNAKYLKVLESYFSAHPELADDADFRKVFGSDADFEDMKQSGKMGEVADEMRASSYIQLKLGAHMNSFNDRFDDGYDDTAEKR